MLLGVVDVDEEKCDSIQNLSESLNFYALIARGSSLSTSIPIFSENCETVSICLRLSWH